MNAMNNSIYPDGYHNHIITSQGDHQHTFTTDDTGSNNGFNIFQPTIIIGNVFIYAESCIY